jgi:hypothetical protein
MCYLEKHQSSMGLTTKYKKVDAGKSTTAASNPE